MRIIIDIGHPAHVHYFKNLIKLLEDQGHVIFVTARDKEMTHELLIQNGIDFYSRGKGGQTFMQKVFYLFKGDFILFKCALNFKPDVFLSFSSPYAAQSSWILRRPHIAFTDTEHATLGNLAFSLFSKVICTPSCYTGRFGKKQVFFNSYMELCYLHPNYFTPNPSILDKLNLEKGEKYIILRFVSWGATHDVGHSGISDINKILAVKEFSKYAKIFITSEADLPKEIEKYRIKIPSNEIHHALYYAEMLYGESATMASECAVLGTPAIYLDNDGRGYTDEEESEYGLVFNYSESQDDQVKSILKGVDLLRHHGNQKEWQKKRRSILLDKVDPTQFMADLVLSYSSGVLHSKKID
jgi:predicted glycosyltransferase